MCMGGDCFGAPSDLIEALIIGLLLLAGVGTGLGALIGAVCSASGRKPRGTLTGGIIGVVVGPIAGPIALIFIWLILIRFGLY